MISNRTDRVNAPSYLPPAPGRSQVPQLANRWNPSPVLGSGAGLNSRALMLRGCVTTCCLRSRSCAAEVVYVPLPLSLYCSNSNFLSVVDPGSVPRIWPPAIASCSDWPPCSWAGDASRQSARSWVRARFQVP